MADRIARTRLEELLLAQRLTIGEFVRAFNQTAATIAQHTSGAASISHRQAMRWISGEMVQLPHPAACRVLEKMYSGETADTLFAAPITQERHALPAGRAVLHSAPGVPTLSLHRAYFTDRHAAPEPPISQDTIEEALSMAAAESARFGQFAEQTNVGPHTLDQLRADLRRIVSVYPNRPVYPLFVEVLALRNRVFELLEGRQLPGQTRELYLMSAALCGVLANASFDLGNFAAAETQARTAFLSAELAGHNAMRAWIRGTQALIAYWDDRPKAAADLAVDGWRYVPENGTARVRLACIEARARARLRDFGGTADALQRAEQAREQVAAPDDPGGMMAFPMAKQQFYAGAAHLWLGDRINLAEAERLAGHAVALYEADAPEDRRIGEMSLARLDLAVTRLAQRDLDSAAEQVELVLEAGGRRRTEAVARRLQQLGAALERPHYQTSALATTMRERICCAPIRIPPALPDEEMRQ